jgi:DNA polymerase (family 10)
LDELVRQGRLRQIPGIGAAIEDKIVAFHRAGTHGTLERLREEAPASAVELLTIPGLSADKARKIIHELGITSLDELEAACRRDELAKVRSARLCNERSCMASQCAAKAADSG